MKTLLPVVATLFFCSSCTSFQYLTINHDSGLVTSKGITTSDSALIVTYYFNGHNAKLSLDVRNNTNKPMTINWKKSALIGNGNSLSLYNPAATFNATAVSIRTDINQRATGIVGEANLPEGSDFVPPMAVITKATIFAIDKPFPIVFNDKNDIERFNAIDGVIKLKTKNFDSTSTPYKIRVYLTYSTDTNTEKSFETEFYIAKVIQTAKSPETMQSLYNDTQPLIYTY
jgi:hypothetical protein